MAKYSLRISLAITVALGLGACAPAPTPEAERTLPPVANAQVPDFWPHIESPAKQDPAVEQQISDMLERMTLEQKVAQIIQPEIRDITVEDMRQYGFGSYLNGGGAFPNNDKHASVQDWVALADAMHQASVDDSLDGSSIPTMWGTDAVHGHNNVIGATLFPHNIGLGAMRDADLIRQIATITATEVRATGIDWIFAPTVAVARDDRWGRTYESYSEDPQIVSDYSAAIVAGLQGDLTQGTIDDRHVIATVKHFLGDGGTEGGDDQGNNIADEEALFRIHAQGYVSGLGAGAQSVMASFNSWHGKKIHGSHYLLTNVLKERMGFDGFVVGDWNGHGQIEGCTNDNCPDAMNAGLDVYMVPTGAWKPLFHNLVAQVKDGTIAQSRLDDAVRRVLRVKMRAGLFTQASPANRTISGDDSVIGAPAHRAVAREAVRKSLVMLKNNGGLLPLSGNQTVLVAGDAADNIGKQSGGWTITWQGTGNQNDDFPGGTSIYDGIAEVVATQGGTTILSPDGSFDTQPDVAIVVFGEEPYAEGNGDLSNVEYQRGNKRDLALLQSLKQQGIPTVSVFITGRPLWVNPELNASDAFVVAWLPGSEGNGVADVLFTQADGSTNYPMHGKLSFSWPATPTQVDINHGDGNTPLFPYGYGLTYDDKGSTVELLPEQFEGQGATTAKHPIHVLTTQAPWQLQVTSSADMASMTSNYLALGSTTIRTMDRRVQEDSLSVTLGQGDRFAYQAPFPVDLRDFSERGELVFDIRTAETINSLSLTQRCGGECQASYSLDGSMDTTSEWQTLRIPLACLAQQGMNLGQTFTVFELSASETVSFELSDVLLQQSDQTPTCP